MSLQSRLQLSDDYYLRRRQIIFRSALVVVVIILSIIAIALLLRKQSESSRDPITSSHVVIPALGSNRSAVSDFSLTFFNGRNFIDYNLGTGSTGQLISDKAFPSVTDVAWSPSGRYATFNSSQQVASDALGGLLVAQGKSLNLSYWWLFDKQTKSFTLLESTEVLRNVYWSADNQLFGLGYLKIDENDTGEPNATDVYKYNLSTGRLEPYVSIRQDEVESLLPSTAGFFYVGRVGEEYELKQQLEGDQFKSVAKSNNPTMDVTSDGLHAYTFEVIKSGEAEQGADIDDHAVIPLGDLSVIEISSGKKVVELKEQSSESHFAFGGNNMFWALTTNPEANLNLTSYNLDTGKAESLYLVEGSSVSFSDVIDLFATDNAVFIQSLLGYNVVSNQNYYNSTMPISLDTKKSGSDYKPYVITQSKRNYSILVTIFGPPADKYKAEALNQLSELGANTDLFHIEYDTTNLEDPT